MKPVPLNDAQREAVEHVNGPILVLAGAGSGKTRVLTARIARLIDEHGVEPRHILSVTFTNKAAAEMKHRVGSLLGRQPDGLWIGTFHSICARLLRREAPLLGFQRTFTIYDEDDSEALIRRVVEDLGLPAKLYAARGVRHEISHAKNAMLTPAAYADQSYDLYHSNIGRIYAESVKALHRANAMDFDDLLLHPLALFEQHPERRAWWGGRFRFVLVDEYQDTNRAQYKLLQHLAGAHSNIFVVGDDDQSIYGWRGADLRNILEFQKDFGDAKLVRLEENYRSTRAILEVANAVIAPNKGRIGKTLRTTRPGGEMVTLLHAADERDEAEWLVREFVQRSGKDDLGFQDMAILVRTNAQTRAFEEELRRRAVPYRVVGAVSFYDRREVKDLLAYLRLLVNRDDDAALMRAIAVPRRGIGETSLVALSASAQQWGWSLHKTAAAAGRVPDLKPKARDGLEKFAADIDALGAELGMLQPAEALRGIITRLSYDRYLMEEDETGPDRVENVNELVNAAAAWSEEWGAVAEDEGTALERFLAQASLTANAEVQRGKDGVTLMTLHAAKGLEFPIVAVAGLEEGLFPLARAETPEQIEEERRLAYVGITRARDKLVLSHAAARRRQGQLMGAAPSRFLADVPPSLVEEVSTRPSWSVARETSRGGGFQPRPRPMSQPRARYAPSAIDADDVVHVSDDLPRFAPGERVKHRRFGSGTITSVAGRGRDLKVGVTFDDEEVGQKMLLAAYAGLEKDAE